MITLELGGSRKIEIGETPITVEAYRKFIKASGLTPSKELARAVGTQAVSNIPQLEAAAYCRWLGTLYRLPTLEELKKLSEKAIEAGYGPEIWASMPSSYPELRRGYHFIPYCEWTEKTETVPSLNGRSPGVLGAIFYPQWDGEMARTQGMITATKGYSFVTFRVARDK